MIDMDDLEKFGLDGSSVGIAQITAPTGRPAIDANIFKTWSKSAVGRSVTPKNATDDEIRDYLKEDDHSVDTAAQLVALYLDDLCRRFQQGTLSKSYLDQIVGIGYRKGKAVGSYVWDAASAAIIGQPMTAPPIDVPSAAPPEAGATDVAPAIRASTATASARRAGARGSALAMGAEKGAQALNEVLRGVNRVSANVTRQNGICYLSVDRADGQGRDLDPEIQARLLREWYRLGGYGDPYDANGRSLFR